MTNPEQFARSKYRALIDEHAIVELNLAETSAVTGINKATILMLSNLGLFDVDISNSESPTIKVDIALAREIEPMFLMPVESVLFLWLASEQYSLHQYLKQENGDFSITKAQLEILKEDGDYWENPGWIEVVNRLAVELSDREEVRHILATSLGINPSSIQVFKPLVLNQNEFDIPMDFLEKPITVEDE